MILLPTISSHSFASLSRFHFIYFRGFPFPFPRQFLSHHFFSPLFQSLLSSPIFRSFYIYFSNPNLSLSFSFYLNLLIGPSIISSHYHVFYKLSFGVLKTLLLMLSLWDSEKILWWTRPHNHHRRHCYRHHNQSKLTEILRWNEDQFQTEMVTKSWMFL